jgi:CRP-like cAMP-binding protein
MDILKSEALFTSAIWKNIQAEERISLVNCFGVTVRNYPKGSVIISSGDAVKSMGILLSGGAAVLTENIEGHRNVIAFLNPGDLFAEVFALSGEKSPVSVHAASDSEAAFLDIEKVTNVCKSSCAYHKQFVWNLLTMIARKNVALNEKIQCIGQRSIREKVSVFLAMRQKEAGKNPFFLQMNRQEMADYLCVDRSALSQILSVMSREGWIEYNKDCFRLKKTDGISDSGFNNL